MPESKSGALTNLATPQREKPARPHRDGREKYHVELVPRITRKPQADGGPADARRNRACRAASPRRRFAPARPMQTTRTPHSPIPSSAHAANACAIRPGPRRSPDSARTPPPADRSGHNPRKRRPFSPTACCVSIRVRRKWPRSTRCAADAITATHIGGSDHRREGSRRCRARTPARRTGRTEHRRRARARSPSAAPAEDRGPTGG